MQFLALIVAVAVAAVPSVKAQDRETAPTEAGQFGPCLGHDSDDMGWLRSTTGGFISSNSGRSDIGRGRLGMEKGSPADVVPVSDPAVCAKALEILQEHLGADAAISKSVAVVRVGGRYIANYLHLSPDLKRAYRHSFYFDRAFTKVELTTS